MKSRSIGAPSNFLYALQRRILLSPLRRKTLQSLRQRCINALEDYRAIVSWLTMFRTWGLVPDVPAPYNLDRRLREALDELGRNRTEAALNSLDDAEQLLDEFANAVLKANTQLIQRISIVVRAIEQAYDPNHAAFSRRVTPLDLRLRRVADLLWAFDENPTLERARGISVEAKLAVYEYTKERAARSAQLAPAMKPITAQQLVALKKWLGRDRHSPGICRIQRLDHVRRFFATADQSNLSSLRIAVLAHSARLGELFSEMSGRPVVYERNSKLLASPTSRSDINTVLWRLHLAPNNLAYFVGLPLEDYLSIAADDPFWQQFQGTVIVLGDASSPTDVEAEAMVSTLCRRPTGRVVVTDRTPSAPNEKKLPFFAESLDYIAPQNGNMHLLPLASGVKARLEAPDGDSIGLIKKSASNGN